MVVWQTQDLRYVQKLTNAKMLDTRNYMENDTVFGNKTITVNYSVWTSESNDWQSLNRLLRMHIFCLYVTPVSNESSS